MRARQAKCRGRASTSGRCLRSPAGRSRPKRGNARGHQGTRRCAIQRQGRSCPPPRAPTRRFSATRWRRIHSGRAGVPARRVGFPRCRSQRQSFGRSRRGQGVPAPSPRPPPSSGVRCPKGWSRAGSGLRGSGKGNGQVGKHAGRRVPVPSRFLPMHRA